VLEPSSEDESGRQSREASNPLIERIGAWFSRARSYLRITGAVEIARRYVAMNGFDGTSTSLGVMLGSALGGTSDPEVIVSACIGASVAMSISGLWGAYIAERAERRREIKELENHMQRDLSNSVLDKASRATAVWVSVINALAVAVSALLPTLPFVLVSWGLITVSAAIQLAVGVCLTVLFVLGIYIGRVSDENPLLHGMLMVASGLVTMVVLSVLLPNLTALATHQGTLA